MSDVGIRVYFLFERRKSLAHKWILVHGYNNFVPKSIEEVSSIHFTPSQWNFSGADAQGMFLLASLLTSEKSPCAVDEMPFLVHLDSFRQRNTDMYVVHVNRATNVADATMSLITQCATKKPLVSKSSLALHELFQFIDDLEQNFDAKRNHSILRLIFQHMQLKLCSLKYPEVRVHFLVTIDGKQSLPPRISNDSEEIVTVEDIEDDEDEKEALLHEEKQRQQEELEKKEKEREDREKVEREERERVEREERERVEREERERKEREEKEREERERKEKERKEREEKEQRAIAEQLLQLRLLEQEEQHKRHLQFLKDEEDRCKRLAEERKQRMEVEQENRRLQMLEQEAREKRRIQEMELARKKQEEKRFEEQKRIDREHRLLEEQRMLEKQKRDLEIEKEQRRVEAEQREKERKERENRLKKEEEIAHRHELSVADVYDFSGDGWNIDNIEFNTSDFSAQSNVYCPLPTLEDMYQVPSVPDMTNQCRTTPANMSFLPKNVILAISDIKEETRSITRWMQRKLCAVYPENKYSLCFISQNFSESDCASVQQFVAQKHTNREWVVIGVECEFLPVDSLSRECTTLLNEFDGRTSLLILELIGMPNTTVVFETTKHFNHVWCWKYNLINTPSSQWFAKASKATDYKDMTSQHQAHSAAMIRLVTYASDQAAAVVRCSNQSAIQKETYFDYVVLGCNANSNETHSLFTFLNEQCVGQKLQNQRWKRRISNLALGDALAIPLSRRTNDHQYDICSIAETEKRIAMAGVSGSMLTTTFRPTTAPQFMQTIPTPSSHAFTTNGIAVDYQFGDPCILKNINVK